MTSIFQLPAFFYFLETTGSLEPFRFSVERDGQVVGVIQGFIQKDGGPIKRFFSRRAIVNGGPYLSEDIRGEEVEELLLKCRRCLRGKAIYIETRNFADFSRYQSVFEKQGFVYHPHYDFYLDTSNPELTDARIGKSRKRDVRSSLNQGVSLTESPTEAEVIEFYFLLKELYHNKVKTPLFPLGFFLQLWRSSFSKFILVKYQEEIIGGNVCVHDDDTVYEWFVCGKDGCYPKIYPSTLATWAAIRFAAEHGFKRFDMMGAGAPGDGGYGVREFKAKFGGELVEYGRFVYVCSKPLYYIGKAAVNIMKKL